MALTNGIAKEAFMMQRIDITNQRFGRLIAIRFVERKSNGNAIWECACDCGKVKNIDSYALRKGITQSCGCLKIDYVKERYKTNEKFQSNVGNADNLRRSDGVYWASVTKGKKNKSGVVGVSFDESKNKWTARLMVDGKYVLLQDFYDFDEAVDARKASELIYLKSKAG